MINDYISEVNKSKVVEVTDIYLAVSRTAVKLVIQTVFNNTIINNELDFADLVSPAAILTFHRRVLLTSHPVMNVVSIDGKATVNNPEIGTPGQVQHLINLYYKIIEDCRNNNKIRSL